MHISNILQNLPEGRLWGTAHGSICIQEGQPTGAVSASHFRSAKNLPVRKLTTSKRGSPWTPDMARTEAKRLLGLIASGEDPAEHPTPGRGLRDR